jgi:hypothetical protein
MERTVGALDAAIAHDAKARTVRDAVLDDARSVDGMTTSQEFGPIPPRNAAGSGASILSSLSLRGFTANSHVAPVESRRPLCSGADDIDPGEEATGLARPLFAEAKAVEQRMPRLHGAWRHPGCLARARCSNHHRGHRNVCGDSILANNYAQQSRRRECSESE